MRNEREVNKIVWGGVSLPKRLGWIVVSVICVVGMAACGSKGGRSNSPDRVLAKGEPVPLPMLWDEFNKFGEALLGRTQSGGMKGRINAGTLTKEDLKWMSGEKWKYFGKRVKISATRGNLVLQRSFSKEGDKKDPNTFVTVRLEQVIDNKPSEHFHAIFEADPSLFQNPISMFFGGLLKEDDDPSTSHLSEKGKKAKAQDENSFAARLPKKGDKIELIGTLALTESSWKRGIILLEDCVLL